MLLQKEKQSIEEIGKKDKKIYERRKVSLSNIYDLLFPQKSRKYFRTNAKEHIGEVSSVKVSFCTSFRGKIKKGSLAVETALVLPLFFLGMVTLISFMDIYKLQTEHLTALCTKAKQAGMYAYLPGGDSVDDITLPDIYTYKPFGGLIPLPDVVVYNHVKFPEVPQNLHPISTGSIIQPVKSAAGIRIRQEWYMLRNRETDTIIWSPAVG